MPKKTILNKSPIIRTQDNIDPVYFTFSPENNATFAELNSDFMVRFILVRFVFITKG